MTQIIDFRNARYQGQTLKGLPHGLGIMVDYKNLFSLAEWKNGVIDGNCLVVFGDSKIFYGQIKNKNAVGICTYHLKDKSQIFCNFEQDSTPKFTEQNPNELNFKNNKLVALLPTFNMIIKVEGQNEQELQISGEEVYRQNDFNSLQKILEKMLECRFKQGELEPYLSLESFIKQKFSKKPEYVGMLDTVQLNPPEGGKELFFTLKTRGNQASLGIRIQNCMQSSSSMTNLHNDGHSYIVKAVGYFTKEGILEYGLKNIKTLIKGNIKQQAIYSDPKTILRYEDESSRPKQCSLNILNYLKRSPNFVNDYLPIKHLYGLQTDCLNINFNVKQTETKKFAQLILENPKQFTMHEKQKIEETRLRKINNGSIQKNAKNEPTQNQYKQQAEDYSKKNEQLEKTKQEIYRSVSKKKIHSNSSSPFSNTLVNSPQKELKPAQLTNVKPMLQIYKNIAQKSFYNSITKNDLPDITEDKNEGGYKFAVGKKADIPMEAKTPAPKNYGGSLSADYIKGLQSRRRLYQESEQPIKEVIRLHSVIDESPGNQATQRKKFSYLPDDQQELSSRPITHKLSYQKNIPQNKDDQNSFQDRSTYNYSTYNDVEPSIYDPHRHYHDHSHTNKAQQAYFRSQRKSPTLQRSRSREEDQSGKLGRRMPSKRLLNDNLSSSPSINLNNKKYSPYEPIVMPEFKISHTNVPSQYKIPLQDESISPNPKRQHQLKYVNEPNQSKSPLKSEQYRKDYLQSSPIRKIGGINKTTPEKYKNSYDVIMDPNANFGNSRLQNAYSVNQRSKSPLQKRKRILNDNPFDY